LDSASPWYSNGKGPWLLAALISVLLAVVAYANGLGGAFVLDDRSFLVDNPHLTEPHNLSYFFSGDLSSYSNAPAFTAVYRPLFFAVLWLGNVLWPGNPLAFHLLSLGLHLAATLLLLAIIPRLLPGVSPLAAGVGACLFAVHPVHVEAVAWVSAFVHPMATALILASYLFHDHHQRTSNIYALGLAGFFFFVALFASETAIGYPFLIIACDWIRHGRPRPFWAAPYFALLALYFGIRYAVIGEAAPLNLGDPGAWLRFPFFLAEYLRHLIFPYPQPLYLAMQSNWEVSLGSGLAAITLVALFCFLLVRLPRDRQGPLFAAAWVSAGLLPPLAAAFISTPLFAMRSLYMPSVGIGLLAAWLVSRIAPVHRKPGIAAIVALLSVALVATTAANQTWLDDGRVFRQVIAFNPENYAGYLSLGMYLERTGETRAAVQQYEKAVALAGPKDKASPLESLGRLLGKSGDSTRSLEIYRQITILEPNRSSAWVGVGNNLWYLGRLPEAANAYRKAHVADAGNREACYNLVLALKNLGRTEEAARYAACAANPP
jgi:tetratricopeptide (TPR) repeat protein